MMSVIVTMAGLGSRFTKAGYTLPKYRLLARGRTLFDWSLESLLAYREEPLVLAMLEAEDGQWLEQAARTAGFANVRIHRRPALSSGQAQTAYDALALVDPQAPLWIYNIDTYVSQGMSPGDMAGASGCIHVFGSEDPGMSYVAHGPDGLEVRRIVEKQVISRWATVGMYGFGSAALFAHYYCAAYQDGRAPLVNGERYIAPMYQLMLDDGLRLVAPRLVPQAVQVLGTPAQLMAFDPLALPPVGNLG